ncbi:damage-inducible protein DinB [Mucilaginibacter corticis]|uniref:Damage-inducible protein DinB n=1 Tax=Mucilaginibacter corticis TaxID=2597670 RepID=A0A556MWW6_9SPHI|nr:DinB family protein [Mucilaginibacter corticis]TSJ44365.1 damage-inducible protein DinB [Mucilaginibacter corticis]
MNKAYFTALAAYNSWANAKAMSWLLQISDEQWEQINASSFSSVKQTAVHIASAEKIWIDFWTKAPNPVYLSSYFQGSRQELIDIWEETSVGMQYFIENHPEENLHDPVTFVYPNGRTSQMVYWQTFAHIMNHSTYHRGQLVTLLRQAGYSQFSSIDMATYFIMSSSAVSLPAHANTGNRDTATKDTSLRISR